MANFQATPVGDVKDKILSNLQSVLDSVKDQVKNKWVGKRVLLCGKGRTGDCTTQCEEKVINEKCGYHKRLAIQEQLIANNQIEAIVFDDLDLLTSKYLDNEAKIIEDYRIDAILILLDLSGPHAEFEYFRKIPKLVGKILVLVDEDYYPYYGQEGMLTDSLKEFIFKDRGHRFIVDKDKNIYKLVEEILLGYFINS